jgi:bifunctional non-homologous end joining protein LigD
LDVVSTHLLKARVSSYGAALHLRVILLDAGVHVSNQTTCPLGFKLTDLQLGVGQLAQRRGYEGLVAKDLSSPYVEARSTKWLKVKVHQEDEFVIAGFTRPAGSRQYFGALLLGAYDKHGLRYVGKVGTGFDQKTLAALYRKFRPFARSRPALWDPPREKGAVFLAPWLVAQISL